MTITGIEIDDRHDSLQSGNDGIATRTLVRNTETSECAVILTVGPGFRSASHCHSLDEHTFVLAGSYHDGSRLMQKGDYSHRPAGDHHASVTNTGCTLLLVYTTSGAPIADLVQLRSLLSGENSPE